MKPTIYLAGAIRDNKPEDYAWRTITKNRLEHAYHILDPLEGKIQDVHKGWLIHQVPSTGDIFVARDHEMIRRADVLLANLHPLTEGYPSIGTLMELGIAMERGTLTVVVGPHNATSHPFVVASAYRRCYSLDDAVDWLRAESAWLSGMKV